MSDKKRKAGDDLLDEVRSAKRDASAPESASASASANGKMASAASAALARTYVVLQIKGQPVDDRSGNEDGDVLMTSPPTTMITHAKPVPIELEKVAVVSRLLGPRACTSITLTFFNPNLRILEGELVWPIADGTQIGGFALDVDGQMVDAVPVEKEKARETYEAEVRKGVDPGLLEHVAGNVYRARVYPLPVNGIRSVRIDVFGDLTTEKLDAIYQLPLPFPKLKRFQFDFAADQSPTDKLPSVIVKGEEKEQGWLSDLKFQSGESAIPHTYQFYGAVDLLMVEPRDIQIRLPNFANRQQVTVTAGPHGEPGDAFFVIDDFQPDVPISAESELSAAAGKASLTDQKDKMMPLANSTKNSELDMSSAAFLANHLKSNSPGLLSTPVAGPLPKISVRLAILWDASGSRTKRNAAMETALLDQYVSAALDSKVAVKEILLDVFVFRNICEPVRTFSVRIDPNDAKDERKSFHTFMATGIEYDGATCFEEAMHSVTTAGFKYSHLLLFTDGFSNLGQAQKMTTFARSGGVPMYIFNSSVSATHDTLRYIALESGGRYYDLPSITDGERGKIGESIVKASHLHEFHFMGVQYDEKEVHEVYVNRSHAYNSLITVVGKLRAGAERAVVHLLYGCSGIVTATEPYMIRKPAPKDEPKPKADKPKADKPKADKSKADKPKADKSKADKPKAKEEKPKSKDDKPKEKPKSKENGNVAVVTPCAYDLVARYWASQKMTELAIEPEKNRSSLLKLARTFQIVTPGTSLLVLENLSQYLQHDVVPPTTLPKIREEFMAKRVTTQKNECDTKVAHIQDVHRMWTERLQWFKTYDAKRAPTKEDDDKEAAEAEAKAVAAAAAAADIRSAVFAASNDIILQTTPLSRSLDVNAGQSQSYSRGSAAAGRSTNESFMGFSAGPARAMPASASAASAASAESRTRRFKAGTEEGQSTAAQTVVKTWDPKTPYLAELKKTMAKWADSPVTQSLLHTIEKAYFELKPQYHTAPSFYFDVAGWFFQQAKTGLGLDRWITTGVRILTNVFEMDLENPQMLRVAAYRLLEAEQLSLAIDILERVLRLRPKEPQSSRDLALALARRAFSKIPSTAVLTQPPSSPRSSSRPEIRAKHPKRTVSTSTLQVTYDKNRNSEIRTDIFRGAIHPISGPEAKERAETLLGYLLFPANKQARNGNLGQLESADTSMVEEKAADHKQSLSMCTTDDIRRSISLFLDVIVNPVDARFREIELTVLTELNNMVARAKTAGLCGDECAPSRLKDEMWAKIETPLGLGKSHSSDWNVLFQPIDCDLRVSMAWDTADTDQDLHVIEPNGEEVFYRHKLSKQGGAISRDFTQGYGPEEYMVVHGRKGIYKIRAKYFASHQASLTGGTTLILSLFTNFGRANETCHTSCVRLQSADQISRQDIVDIGEITLA